MLIDHSIWFWASFSNLSLAFLSLFSYLSVNLYAFYSLAKLFYFLSFALAFFDILNMEDLFEDLTQLKSSLLNILNVLLEEEHVLPFELVFNYLIFFNLALSEVKNLVVFVLGVEVVNKPLSIWKVVLIKLHLCA